MLFSFFGHTVVWRHNNKGAQFWIRNYVYGKKVPVGLVPEQNGITENHSGYKIVPFSAVRSWET